MKVQWTNVRLTKATHARLREYIASLQQRQEQGDDAIPLGRWDEITMDIAINCLLDNVEEHRKRARRQREGRRAAAL